MNYAQREEAIYWKNKVKLLTEDQIIKIHQFAHDHDLAFVVGLNCEDSATFNFNPRGKAALLDSIHSGMQCNYFDDGIFEVSQYQAGKKEDELHIYKETKNLDTALKSLLKGNAINGRKRRPMFIWDNDQTVKGPKIRGVHF